MPTSIIIYTTNVTYLDKTIDGILDNTPSNLIQEIIVCNDGGQEYNRDDISVINSSNIGKAKAWNLAFAKAIGETIVFIKGTTKVGSDWLQPILEILKEEPSALVTPVVHLLDTVLWSSESNRWKRFGWRWDLELYDRIASVARPDSPAISSNCIAVNKNWFAEIGQFDDGMVNGSGEDLELSIRNWLLGGHIFVADESTIACAQEIHGPGTRNNQARIAEVWLPKYAYLFYGLKGIKPSDINTGRLDDLLKLRDKQTRTIEWYLSIYMPELYGIYALKNVATKKRVAIVGSGPSLDYIDNGYINAFDIIIGVEHAAKLFDCDYVISDSITVITELRAKYAPSKFVLPMVITNRIVGELIPTSEVMHGAYQFESGVKGTLPNDVNPPFCDVNNILLTAIHFALFLNPVQITIFGCDNKFIGGRSHTTKIAHYEDGKVLFDTDSTRKNMAFYEYCLSRLGELGNISGIPILRLAHA